MEYKLIKLVVQDAIATITLNRPDKRNAMSDDMRTEFITALEHVNATKAIKALVITGEGKGFCAGGDVAGMQQRMSAPAGQVAFNGWHRQQRVQYAQTLLYTMPKPTIAAVNGPASGLGADLAMACDFIVASESASFAWSYIKRGIIADGGGMYFLPRRIGLPKSKELIYTGRAVDAAEALKLGIADRLSNSGQLLADAQAWAAELSQHSSTALALGKTILNQSFELTAQQVFNLGSQAQGICYTSEEHRASVMAFLDKKSN